MNIKEIDKFLFLAIFYLLCFRTTLSIVNPILAFMPILLGFIYSTINIFSLKLKIDKFNFFLFCILLFYFISLLIVFPLISIEKQQFTPYFAIAQYLFAPLFWAVFYCKYKLYIHDVFELLIKHFNKIGILMALGAIIQYFVSSNLFGLIQSNVYAPAEGTVNPNVTLRAISFISSPQSLGLFLASIFVIRLYYYNLNIKNIFIQGMIFFAGILTGSKAFIIFIGVAIFASLINFKFRSLIYILFGIVVLFFFGNYLDFETLERFTQIGTRIIFLSEYGTFQIWMSFLNYQSTLTQELFGHGLGVLNTSAQDFYNYKILGGSSESYLVQLYFETGIIGLIIFLLFYTLIVIKSLIYKSTRHLGFVLIGSMAIMISTPAFFGFVNNFWIWGILIYVLLWSKRNENAPK